MRPEFPRESNTTIPIGPNDMRKRIGEILDCVNLRGDEFIMARKFTLDMLQHKDSGASQEEVDAFTDRAKHQSRKKINMKRRACAIAV